jgi:hypothetical protein
MNRNENNRNQSQEPFSTAEGAKIMESILFAQCAPEFKELEDESHNVVNENDNGYTVVVSGDTTIKYRELG